MNFTKIPFIGEFTADGKPKSLTVILQGVTYPVQATAKFFNEIYSALKANDVKGLTRYLKMKDTLATYANGAFALYENGLYYKGEEVHNSMVPRILEVYKAGLSVEPMVLFLENLLQNPDKRAQEQLYGFLAACNLPITEDGHFLAYKMIRHDYKDKYTGTMDNSVGARPKMDRNQVDSNPNRTCSRGLHFCSLEYVEKGNYGSAGTHNGDRLVVVKVNPRDVVSIPTDYNNSKGRASEYLILEEIQWTERLKDWYRDSSGKDVDDAPYIEDDFDTPADAPETEVTVSNAAKLNETKVKEIKRLLDKVDNGSIELTLTEIGNMFGVHRTQIQRIRDGQAWAWV